jgi:hypothetical protein
MKPFLEQLESRDMPSHAAAVPLAVTFPQLPNSSQIGANQQEAFLLLAALALSQQGATGTTTGGVSTTQELVLLFVAESLLAPQQEGKHK